jgi:uncharacterized membrane protein
MHARFSKGTGTERITAFSDGVFAIAITLLVLNLRIPDLPAGAPHEMLLAALLADLPNVQVYVLSFLVIGLFWTTHHRVFSYVRRYDTTLVWLNLFLLLFISVLPYPTAMLGRYGGPISVRVYAATLAAVSLFQVTIWSYATGHRRLVDPDLPPAVVRYATLRGFCTLLIFLGSLAISFYSDDAAIWSWLLVPIAMVVLRHVYAGAGTDDERPVTNG